MTHQTTTVRPAQAAVTPMGDWILLSVTVLFGATAVVASAAGRRSHRSATLTRR